MQIINIDKIVRNLKKVKKSKNTKYWDDYLNAFKNEWYSDSQIKVFTSKEWINNLKKDDNILFPDWDWNKFNSLKKHFLELFFDEVNYCPNCWKSPYLSTWNLNLKSFDLDHFFPKSKYKHLMFNFYNLIPICPFCNQKIKRDRNPFDYNWNLFHPYFGTINLDTWKINIINKKKIFV